MRRSTWSVTVVAATLAASVAPAGALTETLPDAAHTVITGARSQEWIGWTIAAAGDFDGDGADDLVTGGRDVAYVVLGGERGTITTGERAFRLGFDRGDRHQILDVAGAGDIDADGFDDVVIGAPQLDSRGGRNAGAAFVVFGRPAPQDLTLDASPARVVRIDGAEPADRAGYSVAGAGDVDGDGTPDVLVGSRAAGRMDRGAAFVVYGSVLTADVSLAALGAAGFRIHHPAFGGSVGYAVASAGDMNRDGLGDVVVGAPSTQRGAAYVVYGSAADEDVALGDLTGRGWTIRGNEGPTDLGGSVDGGDDVDADGVPDVVVGARGALGRYGFGGAAYVIFGETRDGTLEVADVDDHGFRIEAGPDSQAVGEAVALVPDQDGNGFADVLVGDGFEKRGKGYGAVYHLVGQASHEPVDLGRLGRDGVRYGGGREAFVGRALAGVGDFDDDGRLDFSTGSTSYSDENVDFAGAVYLFNPVAPPAHDSPPRAELVSYYAFQRPRLGSHCWDGLCVDSRPDFPNVEAVGAGDVAHFRILYSERPDDFGLTAYRQLDELGRPAGSGRELPYEWRPVRHYRGAPVAEWEAVFRLPRRDGHLYLSAFARWEGLDRGDVSWLSHVRLDRSLTYDPLGSPPDAVLIGGGARAEGRRGPYCWTTRHSDGTKRTKCVDADLPPPGATGDGARARAGARVAVRLGTRHRPEEVTLLFWREYRSGVARHADFWLRRHRVDGQTRAWEVRFRLPRRTGDLYPEMIARWREGRIDYSWHLLLHR